ncbi:peptidase M48, Ste24p [Hydrogenophaga taeniospiralis CCUG 15921]|uniref:Peptidase M48, Ste24p n=1 Tax=Hydrogenophaga taeniospiralis CCUG 15921 TaxID=1281780 RepID=A0A9X4S8W3_9BURK|nr:M48 family metalloprotease [Hydrogenophaga taeniospiralis]MDG5975905.1 peptidase M48, Ste24p [Hydrogenophaga taeniospiralis CCUG 15921]
MRFSFRPLFSPPARPVSTTLLLAALAALPAALSNAQTAGVDAPVTSGLPTLGDGSDMSIAAERRLGDSIAQQLYRDPDYLDDPVLVDYLQSLWVPLLGAARTRGDVPAELSERLAWELMISRDKRVNAFALPGGYLGVHLGLLAVTETPQEVASVLAHELSHVSQRHIARMLSRQDKQAPWLLGAMVLGVLAARANADVANAAIVGSQAVAVQTQLNFSRDMEREADRVGFGVLTGAGFDGRGFVSMFDKLQQAGRLNDDGSFPYLRSHPLTSERIADMRARLPLATSTVVGPRVGAPAAAAPVPGAAPSGLTLTLPPSAPGREGAMPRLPGAPASATPALHALMSARARVLAENGPDRWRAWLRTGQSADAKPGDRYAAALSAHRLGQRDLALSLAQRLRAEAVPAAPETRWAVDALLMELMLPTATSGGAAGAAMQAPLGALRDAALASHQRAAVLLGAQAALATGAARQAAARLQDWVAAHPRDAQAWQTLARAQLALGQRLRAIRAEAEARAAQLDYAGAVERFRAAQSLPAAERASDGMELAIVDVRRREVEALLRESVRED